MAVDVDVEIDQQPPAPRNKGRPEYDGKSAGYRFGGPGPGKKSLYTPELGLEIINAMFEGIPLREVCERPHMPARMTVLGWLYRHEDFRAAYMIAREAQAEVMSDEIHWEAKNVTPKTSKAVAVRIRGYMWRAERLNPKLYAQKTTPAVEGLTSPESEKEKELVDVTQMTKEEYAKIARRLLTEVTTGAESVQVEE